MMRRLQAVGGCVPTSWLLVTVLSLPWLVYGQQFQEPLLQKQFDPLDFVDPLVGTAAGGTARCSPIGKSFTLTGHLGHVFAGPNMPFGMAKPVADTVKENQGGFSTDATALRGFSHMHDSGTGGVRFVSSPSTELTRGLIIYQSPSMGNFPIWPLLGCAEDNFRRCDFPSGTRFTEFNKSTLDVKVGHFALGMMDGMRVNMTAANRTALYQFTFPGNVTFDDEPTDVIYRPTFAIDLADLPGSRREGAATIDFKTGRIVTNGTFQPSFGVGSYNTYACFDFQGAPIKDAGVWKHNQAGIAPAVRVVPDGVNNNGGPSLAAGAFIRFNATVGRRTTIAVRVGMSFISGEQACQNAEREIPTFDFEDVRRQNTAAWREKLKPIEVDAFGVSDDLQKTFWSGIYRTFISPQDYTGENPLWPSREPYYDSYYCIWDSFRSVHPLLTLVDPIAQTQMVRSLIDIYRHEGWLPDCRMSLCKGFTQGGSNADTLLVDSWLKGISQGVNWTDGYQAMIKDAEHQPVNWQVEGRGGLDSWKSLGYIPKDDFDPLGSGALTRSISRTVEYAYNDFNIALMAAQTGMTADAAKYFERSHNWKKLFKADQDSDIRGQDTGFRGFLQPKAANGTWEYQNPIVCSNEENFEGCYLNPHGTETYEGSPWMYTFYVPGDMAALIQTLGGRESFIRRLHFYHETQIQYIGDEQAFLLVYLYHYAGRPALSAQRAHFYIPTFFQATTVGLPGNDDSGAMGSFAALTMMGIFPNPGQNVYFITPPFFRSVSITNPQSGKKATIRNINFDPSYRNIFIQNATLDGKPYYKNWLTHDFFLHGGELELTLGPRESKWGTAIDDLPPSLSTTGFAKRTVA